MEVDAADVLQEHWINQRRYVESLIIVWLDVKIDPINSQAAIIKQLQTISSYVETFDNPDACLDFMANLSNERVLFIVSDSVDLCVRATIQSLYVVMAMYIWSSLTNSTDEHGSSSTRKVKGIYVDMNELVERIKYDLHRIEHNLIEFNILNKSDISEPRSKDIDHQEYRFMHIQLLKDIFSKFQDNNTSEFAAYCKKIYVGESAQILNMINEFERDYEADKAIWWYTRETFLYKLLNKALRTEHVETLYHMRTFIRHLNQQLTHLCPMGDPNQSGSILTLYRGQRMSIAEFEKLKNNEGGLLSVTNFFSTSRVRELAFFYAGQSDDETVAIVFEVTVHLDQKISSSFACIERFSRFGEDEHEWLFSMGTVFRIVKIELLDDIWYINLTPTNDQDETLEKLTKHMSKIIQIERPNPLVPLCRLFARMSEYKKAIELCQKYYLEENNWEIKATLYDTLALMKVDEGDDNAALHHHEQALKTVLDHIDLNDPIAASYFNNVAISSAAIGQHEQAVEHYQKAIDLETNASQPDFTSIAYSYESMGNILYYWIKNYPKALICYERSLELMLAHLPSTHPDIIDLYESIANIYEMHNDLDKVLSISYKRIELMEKNAQSNSRDLIRTYKHVATIYKKQKKFNEASTMLDKSRELAAKYNPEEDCPL